MLQHLHIAARRTYIDRMPHNNGPGFRRLPGMAESRTDFSHFTGAELTAFVPHRPARPEKSEGGKRFKLVSEYQPAGDQPRAITELADGLRAKDQPARPNAIRFCWALPVRARPSPWPR